MSEASDPHRIALSVNGKEVSGQCEARMSLADFLRHGLGLTGTHLGCEHGVCGACTILVEGEAVRGCLMLAVQAEGCRVETIEGLGGSDGEYGVLQQAFADHHALQCGFCTPGLLTTLTAVLRENPDPSETDIREAISGNLCRCTGYQNIVDAAMAAAHSMRAQTDQG